MTTNNKKLKKYTLCIAVGLVSCFFYSCGKSGSTDQKSIDVTNTDTIKALGLNVGGELFSIPSPMQTAMLIQKLGIAYDKSILNQKNNPEQYVSEYSKALNLGIYGADLGYISMYSQTQDAFAFLGKVKNLADKIGVAEAFDQKTMERISNNISNKDSILVLVGVAYRASDAYLKTNKRPEISTLILAGGWIESIHFSIAAYRTKSTDELKYRIADQKQTVNSIIKLITSHNLPEAKLLLADLIVLSNIYDGVIFKYKYIDQTTDVASKTTYINSNNEIEITESQIEQIEKKIASIRNKIVNEKS